WRCPHCGGATPSRRSQRRTRWRPMARPTRLSASPLPTTSLSEGIQMASSTRIKGKALRLALGSPSVDHWADVISVVLDNEEADSDTVTFFDASQGGSRQYFFTINAIQSTDPTSFWS